MGSADDHDKALSSSAGLENCVPAEPHPACGSQDMPRPGRSPRCMGLVIGGTVGLRPVQRPTGQAAGTPAKPSRQPIAA